MRRACRELTASGFSHKTCLPCCASSASDALVRDRRRADDGGVELRVLDERLERRVRGAPDALGKGFGGPGVHVAHGDDLGARDVLEGGFVRPGDRARADDGESQRVHDANLSPSSDAAQAIESAI